MLIDCTINQNKLYICTMKETDLKNNRNLIIETLTNKFGENKVKEIMTFMVNGVEETTTENIEAYLEEVIEIMEFRGVKKDTGNRSILGKLNQLEIENN